MSGWEPTTRPWIVCAANRYGDLIVAGARHHDKIMHDQINAMGGRKFLWEKHESENPTARKEEQGFIDQFGRYYDRTEAMLVAIANNQLLEQRDGTDCEYLAGTILCSEDLY